MENTDPPAELPGYGHSDYGAPTPPPAKSKKLLVIIPITLLLVAGLGFGIWKLFLSDKSTDNPRTSDQTVQTASQAEQTTSPDVPDATGSKLYENGLLGVKLTYPTGWTATETDSKDSVKVESPDFAYQTKDKGKVTGNFRIYIRKGSRAQDGKYIGRGYAIQTSEKLAYKQPAVGQRAETNLSLFGLDAPDNFGFFLIAGNYSLNKGDTLGPDYGKEAETYIIGGGYSSKQLTDDLATNSVAIDLIKTSNAYKQAIEILKSLQLR